MSLGVSPWQPSRVDHRSSVFAPRLPASRLTGVQSSIALSPISSRLQLDAWLPRVPSAAPPCGRAAFFFLELPGVVGKVALWLVAMASSWWPKTNSQGGNGYNSHRHNNRRRPHNSNSSQKNSNTRNSSNINRQSSYSKRSPSGLLTLAAVAVPSESWPEAVPVKSEAGEWLWNAWYFLKDWQDWWLHSLGPFLLSFTALVALRCGVLPQAYSLFEKCKTLLLQEKQTGAREYKKSYLAAAEKPLQYFFLISFVCNAVATLFTPALPVALAKTVGHYSSMVQNISLKICFARFLYGMVNIKIKRSSRGIAQKSDFMGMETSRQEAQVAAVGQSSKVIIWFFTVLTCLPVFHVDIGMVLSFCGAGGLAISLLSKGVAVNLIGSLTLYLTQPFTLGDWIQIEDGSLDGWVQSMGPYHTVVMRWDRRPVYIPNSRFVSTQIINCSRMTNRRILMDVPLRISDLDKVVAILYDINEFIVNHKEVDPEMHRIVKLRSIGPHAAMIWLSCYSKGINLKDFVDLREDVLLSVKNIMFKHGTTFASTLERSAPGGSSSGVIATEEEETFASLGYSSKRTPAPTSIASGVQQGELASSSMSQQAPLDTLSKGMLSAELLRLKQLQENLWDRERELKSSEESLAKRREDILGEQNRFELQRREVEAAAANNDDSLASLANQEALFRSQEVLIDSSMDEMKVREDALDQIMRELRAKQLAPGTESDRPGDLEREQVRQRKREKSVEQADRVIEIHQEMLSQEKKALEQERQALREQKATQEQGAANEDAAAAAATADEFDDEQAAEKEAQVQKIAESLGGE